MVDALRHDYLHLHEAPVLSRLAAEGVFLTLAPPHGFEPDAAIFAGSDTSPDTLSGAQFKLSPETSPFSFIGARTGRFLDRLPGPIQLGARAGVMLANRLRLPPGRTRDHPTPARIPFELLRFFDFSLTHYPDEADFPGATIFKSAAEQGLTAQRVWFPEHDVSARAVLERVDGDLNRDTDLLYLHIGDLDVAGHTYGPESEELGATLKSVDETIGALVASIQGRMGPTQFIVFGDHGMARVRKLLDMRPMLDQVPGVPGQDFVYFLDSTMVRFWTDDEAIARAIRRTLSDVDDLIRLEENPTIEEGPYDRRGLGDLVYVAAEGVLVHPSFYNRGDPPKGMHGYGPAATDNRAAGLVYPATQLAETLAGDPAPTPIRRVYDLAVATLCGADG